MAQSNEEYEPQADTGSGAPVAAAKWGETGFIWFVVALGGVGLWVSAADPIFGGPEGDQVALTLFAFFVALGVAATAAIWWLPAFWGRWFNRLPSEAGGRLEAAKMLVALVFWVLAVLIIVYSVSARWHPVAIGATAGSIVFVRLVVEIWLHHRLGK